MRIPFPPFEPDNSKFDPSSGINLLNCLPKKNGWGPMPSFEDVSDALPGPCLGAVFVRTYAGNLTVIAGTATDLYELNTATSPYSWTEVSKSTAAYSVPSGDKWEFTIFGDQLIAHSIGDVPQYINIASGGLFADLTGAPQAKYSCSAGDFLMFGYLASEPSTVQWSELNNSMGWARGKNGSDSQFLPEGREVHAMISNPKGATIIQYGAMQYMQFAPQSGYTFVRDTANPVRGTLAPHSVVEIAGNDFVYLSEDGFFRGVQGKPIGHSRVDDWFYKNVDPAYLEDVRGMADPFEKIVWWRFRLNTGMNFLLGYSWAFDRWCYSDVDINEAAKLAIPGVSWDGLASFYATIDDVTLPFDSKIFKGGSPTFAGFTSDNRLAFASGVSLAAMMETSVIDLNPNTRSFVNGAKVVSDSNGVLSFGTTDGHNEIISYSDPVSRETRGDWYPQRAEGQLHCFKYEIPAGDTWTIASTITPMSVGSGQL